MTGYESKRAAARDKLEDDDALTIAYQSGYYDGKKAAQPAQKPVAHCEAGPEYCVQCKLEDRSIVLAAAVRYVKNNTPPLVSDEICMALATPPQRPWVDLTDEEISVLSKGHMTRNGFARNMLAKLKGKNNG
jgi:hypothetical protein